MKNDNSELLITEGVAGYYHYHLSREDSFTKALCGRDVMKTEIPLSSWGVVTHLNETWCEQCAALCLNSEQIIIKADVAINGTVFTEKDLQKLSVDNPELITYDHKQNILIAVNPEKLQRLPTFGIDASRCAEELRTFLLQSELTIDGYVTHEGKMVIREVSFVPKYGHSLQKDWWKKYPHPERFNQSNCQTCPYCHIVLGYSYRGKEYGLKYDVLIWSDEIHRCLKYKDIDDGHKKV